MYCFTFKQGLCFYQDRKSDKAPALRKTCDASLFNQSRSYKLQKFYLVIKHNLFLGRYIPKTTSYLFSFSRVLLKIFHNSSDTTFVL